MGSLCCKASYTKENTYTYNSLQRFQTNFPSEKNGDVNSDELPVVNIDDKNNKNNVVQISDDKDDQYHRV